MFDWDDLRVFLATARGGSFAAAASRLGMDATTVGRRIQRLERALETTLFIRSPQGLRLSASGARLQETSLSVERAVDVAREADADGQVTGAVRISASEGFGGHVLGGELHDLLRRRPGLSLELVANSGFLSPTTREVDMAITLSPPRSARLVVERLTDYELCLYGSRSYLHAAGRPERLADLDAHQFVGYIDDLIYAPELRYLDEIRPGLRPRATSSSIRAQQSLIRSGAGLGVLPHFMAEGEPDLVRVLADDVVLRRTFWLSVHQDLNANSRIRVVRQWLIDLVARRQGLFRSGATGE